LLINFFTNDLSKKLKVNRMRSRRNFSCWENFQRSHTKVNFWETFGKKIYKIFLRSQLRIRLIWDRSLLDSVLCQIIRHSNKNLSALENWTKSGFCQYIILFENKCETKSQIAFIDSFKYLDFRIYEKIY